MCSRLRERKYVCLNAWFFQKVQRRTCVFQCTEDGIIEGSVASTGD
jgi:hypothetical protein